MQVIAASPLSCREPKSQGNKIHFWAPAAFCGQWLRVTCTISESVRTPSTQIHGSLGLSHSPPKRHFSRLNRFAEYTIVTNRETDRQTDPPTDERCKTCNKNPLSLQFIHKALFTNNGRTTKYKMLNIKYGLIMCK